MTTEVAAGLSFDYLYDAIGNRQWSKSGGDSSGQNQRQISYTPNALNQYSAITNPRSLDVLVRAPEQTISVASTGNTVTYDDQGDYDFHRAQITSSSNNPQMVPVSVTAGTLTTQGKLWLPSASETPLHDADGNLVSENSVIVNGTPEPSGRWECAWDGENRLVSMRPTEAAITAGAPNIGLDFRYDHRSRRIAKQVLDLDDNNAVLTDLRFAYDGWNLVAEFDGSGEDLTLLRSYTWGPDLSNTLQGAGGVGGLLAVTVHGTPSTSYYPAFDGNGNVIAWSDSSGAVRRRIDYDPFGNVTTVENAATAMPAMPVGFSSKYTDAETGLVYYGLRLYDPQTGRWFSQDSLQEQGGHNLYAFLSNDCLNWLDLLGARKIPNRTEIAREEAQEEAEERAKPPTIDPYQGFREFLVTESEVELAREFLGYTMAMEALRLTLAPLHGRGGGLGKGQREHGGYICKKCVKCTNGEVRYRVFSTGPTGAQEMMYHPLQNITRMPDGTVRYNDLCPEGSEAIGSYHSHPLNNGGTTDNPSPGDRRRFTDGLRSTQLNQNFADNSANKDNISSGSQLVDFRDPSFVGGVLRPTEPVVWRLPNGQYDQKNVPRAPKNNPCP